MSRIIPDIVRDEKHHLGALNVLCFKELQINVRDVRDVFRFSRKTAFFFGRDVPLL